MKDQKNTKESDIIFLDRCKKIPKLFIIRFILSIIGFVLSVILLFKDLNNDIEP